MSKYLNIITTVIFFVLVVSTSSVSLSYDQITKNGVIETDRPLRGINLPGGSFGGNNLPGVNHFDYLFPPASDVEMFGDFGMEVIRLGIKWERLQPVLDEPFDLVYLSYIDAVVNAAEKRGIFVILDPHNYAQYNMNGTKYNIGSCAISTALFASFWSSLATHYKDKPNVIFGLMNEPYQHKAIEWAVIAQEAVTAIRDTGANQTILVPGTMYSAATRWGLKKGLLSNAEALVNIVDPLKNLVFEVHMYLDPNNSGSSPECVSETIGIERLQVFTDWLQENNYRGFLGEIGVGDNQTCLNALRNTLTHIDDKKDMWMGWTYWAASPWFSSYMYNVYPPDVVLFPQAEVLKEFIDLPSIPSLN